MAQKPEEIQPVVNPSVTVVWDAEVDGEVKPDMHLPPRWVHVPEEVLERGEIDGRDAVADWLSDRWGFGVVNWER